MSNSTTSNTGANNNGNLEQLERTVREIEVLQAIYGSENDGETNVVANNFIVHSRRELRKAQSAIGDYVEGEEEEEEEEEEESGFKVVDGDCENNNGEEIRSSIPTLDIELRLISCCSLVDEDEDSDKDNDTHKRKMIRLRCKLLPGYPEVCCAKIVYVSVDGLYRSQQESIATMLQEKAETLRGQEAIMELVQEVQDLIPLVSSKEENNNLNNNINSNETGMNQKSSSSGYKSRQWIWAHHITNTDRRKSIVREAIELNLGGYLKSGYPGIVVVEGSSPNCSEFVTWIKGNKSRPGGFGRNWGHHVKGEIQISPPDTSNDDDDYAGTNNSQEQNFTKKETHSKLHKLVLPTPFEDLGEDMKALSSKCKQYGLEHEFLEYVMQHKNNK